MAVAYHPELAREIFVDQLGVDPVDVTDDAHIYDDLGADSLDKLELVIAFEEQFGVLIPDDAAANILTVGDALRYLETACSKKGGT